jgi:mycothiol synthase
MATVQPVRATGRLSDSEAAEVLALADAAAAADGVFPLSEDAVLRVRSAGHPDAPGDGARHLLSRPRTAWPGTPTWTGPRRAGGASRTRRRGTARRCSAAAGAGPCSSGRTVTSRAPGLRREERLRTRRVLWQMRRPLTDPARSAAAGRASRCGASGPAPTSEAWLRRQRAGLRHHPEQGRWTDDDLRLRRRAVVRPAGFLLAVDIEDTVLGFHWTKVHPAGRPAAIGEIYVLGVDPGGHRRGSAAR